MNRSSEIITINITREEAKQLLSEMPAWWHREEIKERPKTHELSVILREELEDMNDKP